MISGDLPALAACWLSAHEGLRPEEINRLTVDDLRPDPSERKHGLWVHAPRKGSRLVLIDEVTRHILEELVRAGAKTRAALKTRLLFVSIEGPPHVLTSGRLNHRIRQMFARHDCYLLPGDYRLSDGRTTLGTHLARAIPDYDWVRRIMRHASQQTTRQYYQGRLKLESEARIADAITSENEKFYLAYQGEASPKAVEVAMPEQRSECIGGIEAHGQSCGVMIDSSSEHTVDCTPVLRIRWRARRRIGGYVGHI